MKFSRLAQKIRKISGDEIIFRLSRKGRQFYDCYLKSRSSSPYQLNDIIHIDEYQDQLSSSAYKNHWNQKESFYFLQKDQDAIHTFLLNNYPQKINLLQQKANSICNLEIPVFRKKFLYSVVIDWNRDPVSGKTWPLEHWSKIKVVDTASGPDPKFVWELNRHQFFLYTAMSFFVTRQEKYAECTLRHIIDWIENNPIDYGINWVESLEVGTRLTSWIWILELLRDAEALTSDRLATIILSMHSHAEHLYHYLSHYISPNTHLTGEALALFLYSAVYPEDLQSQKWEIKAKNILDEEIISQVGDDGVHKELSTAYHTYTVDYYFQYLSLCLQQKKKIDSVVLDRLEKMCEFVLFAERPDGSIPLIGDSDGGSALPLDPEQSFSWKNILCDAALLFNRSDFKFRSRSLCWSSIWLWGTSALQKFPEIPMKAPQLESNYFKDSNYIVYRSDWSETADYLFFDVGKMGFFSAGHSHADYLSFDLCFSGISYIADVGTYSYQDSFWRNYGRGTRAHNTIIIDDHDQVIPTGSFSWDGVFEKGTGCLECCQNFTLIQGVHNAYPGIAHTRTFLVVKDHFLVCFDQFSATGNHRYELNYHFGSTVSAFLEEKTIHVSGNESSGLLMFPFMFQSPDISLRKGCDESGRGYCFPTYGEKQKIDAASIIEENYGNFIRGMLFLPYFEKPAGEVFKKIESPGGEYYSLFSSNVRHFIYINLEAQSLGIDKDFEIDCDFLIEQFIDSQERSFFAVGVSSFRYKSLQFLLIQNKLSYLIIKQKHGRSDIYFVEREQFEITQEFENVVFHGVR